MIIGLGLQWRFSWALLLLRRTGKWSDIVRMLYNRYHNTLDTRVYITTHYTHVFDDSFTWACRQVCAAQIPCIIRGQLRDQVPHKAIYNFSVLYIILVIGSSTYNVDWSLPYTYQLLYSCIVYTTTWARILPVGIIILIMHCCRDFLHCDWEYS